MSYRTIQAWSTDLKHPFVLNDAHEINAALSLLFEYLCDQNAVMYNPVKGVKRPKVDS